MNLTRREMWEVNKYLWLCLVFAAVYIPVSHASGNLSVSLSWAYGVLLLAILNGAARTYFGWKRGGFNDQRGWVFTIIDVLLVSAAIRITGGLSSDIWLLYFVIIISETLFSTSSQTTLLCLIVAVGYAAGVWTDITQAGFWQHLGTRMFFLLTVASFGLRLSTDRERRSREVARLQERVAASEERARIAREIHDSLGHALVSSILRLELAARLVRKNPEEAEVLLKDEVPALRAAWNEGRNLAFHLRPWEPDAAGFAEGLRKHVARFAERTGLSIDLAITDSSWTLAEEREVCVTRILQEALTNVARHAVARHVWIVLEERADSLFLSVEDDGAGFDVDQMKDSFGLRAMRQRAEESDGAMNVSSTPGVGTRIEVTLAAKRPAVAVPAGRGHG